MDCIYNSFFSLLAFLQEPLRH